MTNINIENIVLKNKIIDLIIEKKPFSLTRIGDGEILVLDDSIDKKLTEHMFKRHLGYLPNDNEKKEIKENLIYSIKNSDGLSLRKNYPENLIAWGKVPFFYNSLDLKDKIYFDHDFHFYLMNDDNFDDILNKIENLTIISSRDVADKIKIKYPTIKNITNYTIPGENMFEEIKQTKNFYPNVYNEIYKDISMKNCHNNLLLLGGGFVGKRLGNIFKEKGGISIDIGSVFDFWVGKVTRGPNRGKNSYIKPLL